MTRIEQITQAANENYPSLESEKYYDGFKDGAKWADEHPSINTVKKIICYALKHTNIIVADDLENAVDWELLIKKAI